MLSGWTLPTLAMLMTAGLTLDWLLGEARRWHPLVAFGNVAQAVERRLNRGTWRRQCGALAWTLVVLPPVAAAGWLSTAAAGIHPWAAAALHAGLLYFCLGLRSLREHAQAIAGALDQERLALARRLTSRIVSRDTHQANATDLAKAAVESTLENGNDAVFGALFWFAIAGGPGALLFRLSNTLDAMWGYRNLRFGAFGWLAARVDDLLNWVPARLTAMSYALLGDMRLALHCWRTQASAWPSPNAGPVMAAGAGSLGLALGGAAEYDGVIEDRPPLGSGRIAAAGDIRRAWRLVAKAALLWIVLLTLIAWFSARNLHA